MIWSQVYDPLGNLGLSTIVAAIPVVVLLGASRIFEIKAHLAALLGLAARWWSRSWCSACRRAWRPTAVYGAAYGLLPIGWIVLNVIFLYQLTERDAALFEVLQQQHHRHHRRPPAAAAAHRVLLRRVLRGRGRLRHAGRGHRRDPDGARASRRSRPSGLSLIANTAPVAFGALGTPIIALAARDRPRPARRSARWSAASCRSSRVIVPFWLIWAFVGFRGMLEVWPAVLVAGVAFAVPQFLVSNFHGPWLVDIVAAIVSMGALALFLRVWQPSRSGRDVARRRWPSYAEAQAAARATASLAAEVAQRLDAVDDPERARVRCGDCRRSRRRSTASSIAQVPDRGPAQPGR